MRIHIFHEHPQVTQDLVQLAIGNLNLRVDNNPHAAIEVIRANCWPTFSDARASVNALWHDANVALEVEKLGRALTRMELVRLRRRIGCDGEDASTTTATALGCKVGPPNVGYPY